mmetsp:Transcript_13717/g.17021  ORF Transcript_13717/g.17021 Transcript_13717/m.17021 type:complete len:195 (+) Transcript_13717:73-657(+)|eukprot:CAMPEP_0204835370 /NCGR_PEP_ID=MMETSP1346-20131115/22417_1 /ASSEMBLY_ACC=CAM_ASM_000771 /TAXON_ID=215587 /ORGANISM="Aplanochytrium stocchinoi, Strain GSBS06" /LENGTH=194 /DNA_ID=CAMNT_0051969307 /DNA_START=420 /DNA_END=1004 /DNA_ORIENTATION=+
MESKWKAAFDAYDLNGVGFIDKIVFKTVVEKIIKSNIADDQIDRLFSRMDLNKDGFLGYEQFESLMTKPLKPYSGSEKEIDVMSVVTKTPESSIEENATEESDNIMQSSEEAETSELQSNEDVRDLDSWRIAFNEYDRDKDGVLSWPEFKIALERATGKLVPKVQGERIFTNSDFNNDGVLDYAEFDVLIREEQ